MKSNTFSQTSQHQDLHPNLKAALATLDVNLEDALNRYRQYYQQNDTTDQSQQDTALPTISSQSETSSELSELSELSESNATLTEPEEQGEQESSAPQDHLASSEELLRQLNDFDQVESNETSTTESNQQEQEQTASWRKAFLTPFAVVGSIILLMSGTALSLTLIYSDFGESWTMGWFPWNENGSDDEQKDASSEAQEKSATQDASNGNQNNDEILDSATPTPNLTQGEFYLENNPLENPLGLVELEPADELPPSAKPTCGADYYCVMVEKPTEQEIQKVKAISEDAYMREFPKVGQVLQVAAHNTESRAQQLMDQLEGKGISASIYPPDSE